MEQYREKISVSPIFRGIETRELNTILEKISNNIHKYNKNTVIANEGDPCDHFGILLEGHLEVQKAFPSGKVVTISTLEPLNTYAEAVLFSENNFFPSTIYAVTESRILIIPKNIFTVLLNQHERLMTNFLSVLSDKLLILNQRLRLLSQESIRQKIAFYLLEQYRKKRKLQFEVQLSREKMSQMMNVQRPSLSRELINLRDEGYINFDKNIFTIIDLNGLEELLYD